MVTFFIISVSVCVRTVMLVREGECGKIYKPIWITFMWWRSRKNVKHYFFSDKSSLNDPTMELVEWWYKLKLYKFASSQWFWTSIYTDIALTSLGVLNMLFPNVLTCGPSSLASLFFPHFMQIIFRGLERSHYSIIIINEQDWFKAILGFNMMRQRTLMLPVFHWISHSCLIILWFYP